MGMLLMLVYEFMMLCILFLCMVILNGGSSMFLIFWCLVDIGVWLCLVCEVE